MTTRIKICGITRAQDAHMALAAGADYLGLIFVPHTPRCLTTAAAQAILADLPRETVQVVGVFQNQSEETIRDIITTLLLNWVQLHGKESPDLCAALPVPVIKTFSPFAPIVMNTVAPYRACPNVQAFLLDKPKTRFEPSVFQRSLDFLRETRADLPPLFVAGGLTPEVVAPLIRRVRPFGVDVASGVESAPGCKDPDKLRAFCQSVQQTDEALRGVSP